VNAARTPAGVTVGPTDVDIAAEVLGIVAAVEVHANGDVSVEGRLVALGSASRKLRLRALERALYERFHAGRSSTLQPEPYPDAGFRSALEDAVQFSWSRERDWRVVARDGDRVRVERDGLQLAVDRHRDLRSDREVHVGTSVELRLPPARPALSPGFFTVLSPQGAPAPATGRLYVNLPAGSVAAFLGGLTRRLSNVPARWAVKTLGDPSAYGRRDGTVVYVEQRTLGEVRAGVRASLNDLPWPARADLPPLALALAPDLAYADEPVARPGQPAMSFGQHRMTTIARAALGPRSADGTRRARRVERILVDAGIDPTAPYRNLGKESR